MHHNGHGEVVRADEPRNAMRDDLGSPRFGWRRLRLADALSTADPGSRLASAITDSGEGAGIVFPLNGGWGSNDWSGAYPYVMWGLEDLFGRPLGGSVTLGITFRARLFTSLAATDEFVIGVALVNESVLTGSTVDGKGVMVVGTGAGVNLSSGNVNTANGTGTLSAGTMTATTVGALGTVSIQGGTLPRLYISGSLGINASGDSVSGAGSNPIAAQNLTGIPSRWYVAAFAGRTSAGVAAAKSPAADFHIAPLLRTPLAA
jgi:hypothetical protein